MASQQCASSRRHDLRLQIFDDQDAGGSLADRHRVVGKGSCRTGRPCGASDLYQIKEFVRRCVAEFALVFKNDQLAAAHKPPGRRAVMLEHVRQSIPEQVQVIVGKAGLFRQQRGDKVTRHIQAVGYDVRGPMVRSFSLPGPQFPALLLPQILDAT